MNIADKNALRGKKEGHGKNNQYAVSHGVCTMIRKEEDVDTKSSIFLKIVQVLRRLSLSYDLPIICQNHKQHQVHN